LIAFGVGVEAFCCCQTNNVVGGRSQLFGVKFDQTGGFYEIIAGQGAEKLTFLF